MSGRLQFCDIWKVRRAQFSVLVASAAVISFLFATNTSAAEPKRVLIINSWGSAAPPFTIHATSFESDLVSKMEGGIALDEVALDVARNDDGELQQAMVEYLEKRQAKWKPDLVVPIGSPAALFAVNNRERLFPEAPILVVAGNREFLPSSAWEKNVAFVGHVIDMPGYFEDILQVAPATKNIEIVLGGTSLERTWREALQKAAKPLADRIKFTYYNDLSFDQMLERVAKLPPDSYIFFFIMLRDAGGVTVKSDEALQRIHQVANAPINALFVHQLGTGIVGGRLLDGDLLGKNAADVAIRILRGEPAASIPPILLPRAAPRYDWRELRRWKISEKLLPPGSTVLFREPTVWERYRTWIISGLSILILQGLLLTGLLVNRIRRRRAEVSLGESEERFQTMADAAPVLIWVSGEDKLPTYFNKAWLEFTGRSMDQERSKGWKEGVHPDDLAKISQTYGPAVDRREPFVMQYRLKNRDGEFRWITDHGVPRYGPGGNFRGYVGACLDITDLLKKEATLRQFEERVALAADAAQHGVWELDTITNELWVSDKVRTLLELDGDAPTDEDFQGRVHSDDRAARDAAIKKAIATKGDYELEYRVLLRDEVIRWIGERARCLPDEKRELTRLLGVSVDITKRKQAEEEAHRHREQINLLSRVSLLGEMTASLAHELNQPLSAIITNANAGMRSIDRGKKNPGTLREILVDVEADGRRAHDIIRNVRNTVKKSDPTLRRINLNELVAKVAHIIRPDAVAYSCEVETSLAKDLPVIEGDPVQIQQVLVNLVSNALDAMRHTPPGQRKVEISTAGNGDNDVRLSVRDHGTGIRTEVHERLFDRFFTTKEQGLGMGLAIVRSIVESHGGDIQAENVADGGARFYFTLPVKKKT